MRNRKNWLVLLLLPLFAAVQIWAQGLPTGSISGRVINEGQGLPGVTVTAKSPALQGSRTAVTNVNGDYVIPNLPPGDYSINFTMPGFQAVTKTAKVPASQQVVVNSPMSISAVAAEATVVAQSETVSQTAQASTTYNAELTNKLPTARTLLASVVLSPGVNANGPNGNVTVSGAQSFDNNFTVNGVNIQDNIRGTPTSLFIEDAIQETTTMTSGVSAEYGRFTGGVINAVTKQGGNTFSGSFRVTLRNDDWQAQTPIVQTYTDKTVPTYEATIGGPIWKDRIWFFGAGRYTANDYSGVTNAPTNLSFPRKDTDKRYEGKLTITPFANQTITGSYTNFTTDQDGYYFTPLPILDLDQTYSRSLPSDLLAINYNGVITSNVFIEAQYSAKNFKFENSGSRWTDLIKGTAVSILDRGYAMMWSPVFCGVCPGSGEERNNQDILVKGTWFLSTKGAGSHNIVFGYDNFSSERLSNNFQSGNNWWLYATSVRYVNNTLYPVIDENSYFTYYPILKPAQPSDMRTHSVFVNDTWKLNNKLSFNIGVRWDKNAAKDSQGATTADDSAFSPRLAATYDVAGDGKFRVTASYARYVGQIQEGIAGSGASPAGAPSSFYYYWTGKGYNTNPNGPFTTTDQILREMFAAIGVTTTNQFPTISPDFGTIPGLNLKITETLSSPYGDEYVLGFGGTVGSNMVFRVDGVRRVFKDFYMTKRNNPNDKVTDQFGNISDVGYIVNSNLPEREYTGLHTSFAYRLANLNLAANWTWSHMLGNFVGETAGSGPVTATFLNYPEYFDLKWFAPRGDLSQDQRHRVRLLASYDWKLGNAFTITPGMIWQYDAGTPYGASGNIASAPYVTNPGYATPPSRVTYYFTSRDAFKSDDVWRTDISLNLSGRIGPVEIFVQPQVLNLFNNQAVTAVNTSVTTGTSATPSASSGLVRFNPFTTTPIECPQTATAAECRALGANWKKGPSFGTPTTAGSYQIPRRWFVSMGVRF